MTEVSQIVRRLNVILSRWVDPTLLKPGYYGKSKQSCVSFEVCMNQETYVIVKIMVRWDPFGQTTNICERTHYSITYINDHELMNQLFHALTFQSSPYYLDENHFKKRMEVAG